MKTPLLLIGASLLTANFLNAAILGVVDVDNPSFENPETTTFDVNVTGWFEENKTAGDGLEAVQDNAANTNVPQTTFGSQWMNLSETAAVYQQIDTFTSGFDYTFSGLLIGDRSNKLFGQLSVELWVGNGTGANDTALSSFASLADSTTFDMTEVGTPSTQAIANFTLSTGTTFTAGDSVWLRFSSIDGGGASGDSQVLFDNVNITAVPEPTTTALLVGLIAFGAIMVRRRKA
jgi:hypothetical protein